MAQVIINNITNCTFTERTKNVLKSLEELAHQYEEFEYNFGFNVKINANIIKNYYDTQYVDVTINTKVSQFTRLFINAIDNPIITKSHLFCDTVFCGSKDENEFSCNMKLDEYYILGDMLKVFEEWKNPAATEWVNILKDAIGSA